MLHRFFIAITKSNFLKIHTGLPLYLEKHGKTWNLRNFKKHLEF